MNNLNFWIIARRPQWVFGFFVALLVAAVLALLANWQWGRGIQDPGNPSEEPVPLLSVQPPSVQTVVEANGRMVTVDAKFDGAIFIIEDRYQDDRTGYWVSARFKEAETEAILFTALGFTENPEQFCNLRSLCDASALAGHAITKDGIPISFDEEISLLGRFSPPEPPVIGPDGVWTKFSTIALINTPELDSHAQELFNGFLIQANLNIDGLEVIKTAPAPVESQLNWLNIFYAIEWVFFAVFTVYVWYRLVRDALERELEDLEESVGEES